MANRYALAPMTNKLSHHDGTLSEDGYRWLVARSRGGFGVVKTCAAYVADTGRTWAGQLGIASDKHLPGLSRLPAGLRRPGPDPLSNFTMAVSAPTRDWPAGSSGPSTTLEPGSPG